MAANILQKHVESILTPIATHSPLSRKQVKRNDDVSNKKIVEEGAKHFLEHTHYINPYPPGTDNYNDFERGWAQKQKRSDNPTSTTSKGASSPHERHSLSAAEDTVEFRAQRYRMLKG
ncbi:MAG: hypothetical protein KDB14_34415 [Planctomycetales bacterium]|nr:hypothetical protein [Planctomycetales bacterium]